MNLSGCELPKLNGSNYAAWILRIKPLLQENNVNCELDENNAVNAEGLSIIHCFVSDAILPSIRDKATVKQTLEALEVKYGTTTDEKKFTKMSLLFSLRKNRNEALDVYCARGLQLFDEINSSKALEELKLPYASLMVSLLNGLPTSVKDECLSWKEAELTIPNLMARYHSARI